MIDLHMHSQYSDDGEFAPEELVRQCCECDITVMSVTDHNCARANGEAEQAAQRYGIRYIPGIEIDCTYKGVDFHVLGYGIDWRSEDFASVEENIRRQCIDGSHHQLLKTQELGFPVTAQEMEQLCQGLYWKDKWTGDLFAELLLHKPELKDHPLLKPYRPDGARSDNPYVNFYWDYYSQGKPCYYPFAFPSMEETIRMIHRNQGIAVLAHPGINLKGHEALLPEIIAMGIDGIEAYSSYHSPIQAAFYARIAQENRLQITCGSDYHGKTKPSIFLGATGCDSSAEKLVYPLHSL